MTALFVQTHTLMTTDHAGRLVPQARSLKVPLAKHVPPIVLFALTTHIALSASQDIFSILGKVDVLLNASWARTRILQPDNAWLAQ
jgi:hypothetical protein